MSAKSPITTHVLDVSQGRPAAGIAVRLEFLAAADQWQLRGQSVTNDDGRVVDLLEQSTFSKGRYRLTFATGDYFSKSHTRAFYPSVTIEFLVEATTEHYHVPLLLSPFGYSTYRGS